MRLQVGQALQRRERVAHCRAALGVDTHEDNIAQSKHEAALQWLVQPTLRRHFHLSTLLPVPTHDKEVCEIVHQLGQGLGPATRVRGVEEGLHCLDETLKLR